MTLALHGKSKQRQWLLVAVAFWAVVVGSIAAVVSTQVASAEGPGVFQENQAKSLPIAADDAGFLVTEACDRGPYADAEGTVWHFVTTGSGQPQFVTFSAEFADGSFVDGAITGTGGSANKHVYVLGPAGVSLVGVTATTEPVGAVFVLSHICGAGDTQEDPEATILVEKTADTRFTRTHAWSIDKSVTTENEETHNGLPKIWLYTDGSGDETATWTVDVEYEGATDSDFEIYGTILVRNIGDVPVTIVSIVDDLGLAGYEDITLDCDVDPNGATLLLLEEINCTYAVALLDGEAAASDSGTNTVTVEYSSAVDGDETDGATADWAFDEPTTEINATVNINDISDLFGEVALGSVTAPNGDSFTYGKDFAYADYGPTGCGDYQYDNTATIVETGDSASASLLVNVQCYVYETAFGQAAGTADRCFLEDGISRWGWTNNYTVGNPAQTYDLWAGAGQCKTEKGTLVGTVKVETVSGRVVVTFNLGDEFLLDETHVYVGTGKYPTVKQGKKLVETVAPGQFTNTETFTNGTSVWVIAHAVVGIPDPNFGPQN